MDSENKEFFDLLENEGMEGILKKYQPIEDVIEDLDAKVKKLKRENAEYVRALYLAAKNEKGNKQITTRSIFLKYLKQARIELEKLEED